MGLYRSSDTTAMSRTPRVSSTRTTYRLPWLSLGTKTMWKSCMWPATQASTRPGTLSLCKTMSCCAIALVVSYWCGCVYTTLKPAMSHKNVSYILSVTSLPLRKLKISQLWRLDTRRVRTLVLWGGGSPVPLRPPPDFSCSSSSTDEAAIFDV